MSRRIWWATAAVTAQLWAVSAVVSLAAGRPDAGSPRVAARQAAGGDPSATVTPDAGLPVSKLPEVQPQLEDFVAKHQGLQFLHEVTVDVLDDAAFERAWERGEPDDDDRAQIDADREYDTRRALGLVQPYLDRAGTEDASLDGLQGFYDADARELAVRGTALTPYVRGVIVHELTHALQHQHHIFDEGPQELVSPLQALLEGSAMWTQRAYYDQLTAEEKKQYDDAATMAGTDNERLRYQPDAMERLWSFRYQAGHEFVEQLVTRGGGDALRSAYETPPTTSEQVLSVEAYERRERPKRVAVPAPDGPAIARGVVGQAGLFTVLVQRMSEDVADVAARGWGGDKYVVYRTADGVCARLNLVMDTPVHATELRRAFDEYAQNRPDTTVSGGRTLSVTMCEED